MTQDPQLPPPEDLKRETKGAANDQAAKEVTRKPTEVRGKSKEKKKKK